MGGYSTGLFGCLGDCNTCVLGTFCPCYLLGTTHGKQTPGDGLNVCWCILGCFGICLPCGIWVARSRVHVAYGIEEGCCGRCITWWYVRSQRNGEIPPELEKRRSRGWRERERGS